MLRSIITSLPTQTFRVSGSPAGGGGIKLSTTIVTVSLAEPQPETTRAIYWLVPTGGTTLYVSPVPNTLPSSPIHDIALSANPGAVAVSTTASVTGPQSWIVVSGTVVISGSGITITNTCSSTLPQSLEAEKIKHCSPVTLPEI